MKPTLSVVPATKRAHAFTLIELAVVLCLLALWGALLVPALARSGGSSQTWVCRNNLQQLQRAQALYSYDNRGNLVANATLFGSDLSVWARGSMNWGSGLPMGANTNAAFLTNAALGPYIAGRADLFKCPADKIPSLVGPRVRSYSMNAFCGSTVETTLMGYLNYRCFLKDSDLTLPGPSRTWVLTEEHPDSINDNALLMRMPAVGSWPDAVPWEDVPAAYHNGAACLSFADGHVEVHQWLDEATKAPIQIIGGSTATGLVSPQDSRWLVERSSAPR